MWGESQGYDTGENAFAFQGQLTLPSQVRGLLGWSTEQASITGTLALGAMSLWAGFVASASEAIDLFGWDDNLTIPVLCGVGLWGFMKFFA
jgi:diacylglycerol kinase (CTP)